MNAAGGWLQLTSGRGPAECGWVIAQLLPKLVAEATAAGLDATLLETTPGPLPGTLGSALLAFDGEGFESFAARWSGSVQWIGTSPFRPAHKRRNWFVAVDRLDPPRERPWRADDVRVETMRAGGPGGQHVNRTDSAVRLTHRPSGLQVLAREERSQQRNRRLAEQRLAARLAGLGADARAEADTDRWRCHDRLTRGDARRVFVGPGFDERR